MFSKKSVLFKKCFVLKLFTQTLFQYICVPNRFKIGKLDWPIFI